MENNEKLHCITFTLINEQDIQLFVNDEQLDIILDHEENDLITHIRCMSFIDAEGIHKRYLSINKYYVAFLYIDKKVVDNGK